LNSSIPIFQADLAQPLTFLDGASFDVVLSPLVLNYIEDWTVTMSEFYRVLVSSGHLVFSVSHPFSDFTYFKSENYFRTEFVGSEWRGFGERVYMPSFRHSLSETVNPVIDAGFVIERILEPKPTEEFRKADPEEYEELMRQPVFLCIRSRK
jgi:SAM-dependent methyltransferase